MHKVADRVEDALSIPLLHIGDTTAAAIHQAGVRRVGLLGTGFTMTQPFYRGRLERSGLEVLVPPEADQRTVHDIIYRELCLGVIRKSSRDEYRRVIRRLVDAGAEGVIYGCTEIELLVRPNDSPVAVFPTTRLHVAAVVDLALSPRAPEQPEVPASPPPPGGHRALADTAARRTGGPTHPQTPFGGRA